MQPAPAPFQPLRDNGRYAYVADIKRTDNSFVQLAEDRRTGERVAIKFFARGWSVNQSKYVLREILNHQHLSLTNFRRILGFKEVFLMRDYLGVVIEHVEGLTLHDYLLQHGPRLDEATARSVFQQLILAVYYCHRTGIVNRDIAPTGVVLHTTDNKLSVKLSEFTYSKHKFRHSLPCTQVGAALYVAPEIMLSSGVTFYDGSAADVWSCGVVLYVMLFGRHPFLMPEENTLSENQQLCKFVAHVMKSEIYIPPEATDWSRGGLELCKKILVAAPAERVTVDQILADEWFRTDLAQNDVDEVRRHLSSASYASAPQQPAAHIEQLVQQASQPAVAFPEPEPAVAAMPLDADVFSEDLVSSSYVFKDMDYGLEAMSNGLGSFPDPQSAGFDDSSMFADSSLLDGFGFADAGTPWYVDGPAGHWNAPFHQFGM